MTAHVEKKEADLYSVIHERTSIRSYDPEFKISEEELKDIISESLYAPSSSNLQPWRFLVILDQEIKNKLLPIAHNQKQIVDSSATIVVLGDLEAYKEADKIYDRAVAAGMPKEFKESYVPRVKEAYSQFPYEKASSIALIDGGLISMQLMLVAKAKGYDTVPMGGFDSVKLVEEFKIPSHLIPVMLISVGKAAAPGFPKARLTVDEVTSWNSLDESK
jgi:nitroreductase